MATGGGIRGFVADLAHRPIKTGWAERFLYTMGVVRDAIIEKGNQGAHDTMALQADESALPLIGAGVLIPQGLTESADNYRLRLQRAWDDWQIAGNAWSVMRQVLGYLLDHAPDIATVSAKYTSTGTLQADIWNFFFAGADTTKAPTRQRDNVSPAWDWDSTSPTTGSWGWHRWWLIIYSVAPNDVFTENTFTWGTAGKTWGGTGESWGLAQAPEVVGNMREIVRRWKGAHAWCVWMIIAFSNSIFDPNDPSGGGVNPDGSFGRWSKVNITANTRTASRFSNARYASGV